MKATRSTSPVAKRLPRCCSDVAVRKMTRKKITNTFIDAEPMSNQRPERPTFAGTRGSTRLAHHVGADNSWSLLRRPLAPSPDSLDRDDTEHDQSDCPQIVLSMD